MSAPEISFTLNNYPSPSMVIAALSQETVRLLGSPTVITTPVDLVKELLDNALDAKATSVEVLVAPNLVDRIEVRDNGHGISQEDYDSLGRTGHTSKITSFDEIPYLGGTTLGFGGQALASANTLGKVTVTTRTSKDPTAMLITLRARVGGVDGKQRTSAPAGTTVGVTGLYSNLPVRVRTAIKDAPKNMSKIKQLLHEYALARPGTRLSFKSLGGKAAWSYSPRPQATVREAVVQTFGTEVMSQCMIRTICSSQADDEPKSTQDNEHMSMQAVLPSADGDLTKVANKGAFFAVDSRPLTSADGAMKKLLKTFKSFLARTLSETDGHHCPRDPFVCVNIRCSPGSYDVNVEPSKNQVIFASESRLTDLFERLCTEVYRTPQNTGAFATLETRRLLQGPQTQTPPLSSDGPEEDARPDKQAPLASSHGSTMHDSTVVGNSRAFQSVRPYGPGLGSPKQSLTTTCGTTSSEVCHTRKAPHTGTGPVRRHAQSTPGQECLLEAENIDADLPNLQSRARTAGTTTVAQNTFHHPSLEDALGLDVPSYLDMSSDEEAEILASCFRGQPDARIRGQNRAGAIESPNTWTMARNIAPIQQPLGRITGDAINAFPSLALQAEQTAEDSFEDLPVLQPHDSLAGNLQLGRPIHMDNARPAHQPYLPSVASHSTLECTPDIVSALDALREAQSPSRFNGRHPLPNRRPDYENPGGRAEPDGLVQTTISFSGTKSSKKPKTRPAQLHVDDVPSRPNPPYRKPWKDNHGERGPKASRKSRNAPSYAIHEAIHHQMDMVGCDGTGSLSNEGATHPEAHALHRPEDGTLESTSIAILPKPTNNHDNEFESDAR